MFYKISKTTQIHSLIEYRIHAKFSIKYTRNISSLSIICDSGYCLRVTLHEMQGEILWTIIQAAVLMLHYFVVFTTIVCMNQTRTRR